MGALVVLIASNSFESETAHALAGYFDQHKKPDYCAAIREEAVTLKDALHELDQPGAVYCHGFDYTTHACFLKQRAIRQAIMDCFSTSYFYKAPFQTQST